MKILTVIAASVMLFVTPVWSSPWWQPSSLSVALTVGQWLIRDQVQVFYLQVQASGADQQQARDQAFRLAVEQAVGSLLVSETEVRNNDVMRNEILNYSSGYVHDFKIVSEKRAANGIELVIDVWVKHSTIADRVLHIGRDSAKLESDRIAEQIRSIQHERAMADRLLATVLNDFPKRSFDIRLEPSRVLMTPNRQTHLEIPMVIGWNEKYVSSLREVIAQINQRPDCDSWLKTCNLASLISVAGVTGYFDDTGAYDLMHKEMVMTQPQIHVRIHDQQGQVRFQGCYSAPEIDHANWSNWNFVELGGYKVMINAARSKRYVVTVPVDSHLARSLHAINVTLIRKSECRR